MSEDRGFSCRYYKDIVDQWAPFTRDEEMAFRSKMLSEGRIKELKDELVLRNAGLIAVYGGRWRWLYTAEDAVSIGITGLYKAADTFDFDRTDVRFPSYAGWYLKKAFNSWKDDYRSRVDENSVPFDQPVGYTDTAGDEDSMALGDALSRFFDPDSLALKNDVNRLFDFDVEEWMLEKLASYRGTNGNPVFQEGRREAIRRMMVVRLRHPEYTLETTAKAAGLINRETGKPVTRERIRQLLEQGKFMLRASVRDEVARRMAVTKPDVAEFFKRYGQEEHNLKKVRSRLRWKDGKYEIEDYVETVPVWEEHDVRETTEYRSALKLWERSVDKATDDYFSELFGHRFVDGTPVKYNRHAKSDTADENRIMIGQMLPARLNRHSAASSSR